MAMVCVATGVLAADKVLEVSELDETSVSLTEYFAVLEDPGATLSLADMQNTAVANRFTSGQRPSAALSYGFTRSAYWLRLTLRNASDRPVDRVLEIGNPLISDLQVYQPTAAGGYRSVATGSTRPFATRPHRNRFFVFPITLSDRADQVIFLRLQSTDGLLIPARLWEPEAFHGYERNDYVGQAWYFGMATAMVLFNLLLFVALRDVLYLLYINFVVCGALALAAANGLGHEFLWPEATLWSEISHYVGYSLGLATLFLFTRPMLETKKLMPKVDRVLKLYIGVLLLAPIAFAVSLPTFAIPAVLLNSLGGVLFLAICVLGIMHRRRSAYLLMVAFAMLIIGGVMTVLRGQGLLPTNMLTLNGMQLGSALELLLLAFAPADRFNAIRAEKAEAQRVALEAQSATVQAQATALLAEQELVAGLRASERVLEGRVAERSAELSATIARVKKTQADLVQADKLASLGALVAGVAHELNTPIGNAFVTASGLSSDARKFQTAMNSGGIHKSALTAFVESAVPMAGLIVRSCDRAAVLINSFTQVAVEQTSEPRQRFELRTLIEENVTGLRSSLPNAVWTLEIDIEADIVCEGYVGPLRQVVTNLVQNAATHAFVGRPSGIVRVSATRQADFIELVFTDNGVGMEPAILARIFEPFYTTRLGKGGSGLGLSIALNVVTRVLGGMIYASSEPGLGSRFTVNMPLIAPHPAQQSEPASDKT